MTPRATFILLALWRLLIKLATTWSALAYQVCWSALAYQV